MATATKTKRAKKAAAKSPAKSGRTRSPRKNNKPRDSENLRSQVAKKAYAIYESRGQSHGDDQADWYEAEQILKDGRGSIRVDY